MKLLFDQNLSHRLVQALDDLFPGSLHVRLLGMAQADDLEIWEYAKALNLVIVTQDSDYSDWNKLRGAPPKLSGYGAATLLSFRFIKNSVVQQTESGNWVPI
jgi:hypothetical protein